MKHIAVTIEDELYNKLQEQKGDLTWIKYFEKITSQSSNDKPTNQEEF